MRLGKILATASAVVLVSAPLSAQSDVDTAREVYPFMIECGMVSALSAEYGYTARHSMEEWAELIGPTAEMIGADTSADIEKYGNDLITRMERDGLDAAEKYIVDTAKTCDDVLDSID